MAEAPSRAAMLQTIRRIWEEGLLISCAHFEDRQGERSFSHADLLQVLETGEVVADPVWDDGHENWSAKVAGTNADGETVTVVLGVDIECDTLYLVTIYA